MTPKPIERFPILKESFLYRRGARVHLSVRKPIELDRAHEFFFDGIIQGGRSVRQLLNSISEADLFAGEPPSEEGLVQLLSQPESFVQVVPFEGRESYDAIVVDLESRGAPETMDVLHAMRSRRARVLAILGWDPGNLPGSIDVLAFRESRSSPIGSFYRFVQFSRTILGYTAPTRLYVSNLSHALFFLGCIERHSLGLGVRTSLAPFVIPGPPLLALRGAVPDLYIELLFWLRTQKKRNELFLAVSQTSAASMAGWLTVKMAHVLFAAETGFVDSLSRHSAELSVRVERAAAPAVRDFLFPSSAARRSAALSSVASSAAAPLRKVELNPHARARNGSTALFGCADSLETLLDCTAVVRAFRRRNPADRIAFVTEERLDAQVLELCPEIDVLLYAPRRAAEAPPETSTEWISRLPEYQKHEGFRHVFDGTHLARMLQDAGSKQPCHALGDRLGLRVHRSRPSLSSQRVRASVPDECPTSDAVVLVPAGAVVHGARALPTRSWPRARWNELARSLPQALDERVISMFTPDARSGKEWAGLLSRAALLITSDPSASRLGEAVGVPVLLLTHGHGQLTRKAISKKKAVIEGESRSISVGDVVGAATGLLRSVTLGASLR